jgi:hypothetical protein
MFSATDAASIVGKEMKPSLLEELVDLSILQRITILDEKHLYRFHRLVGHYVADRLRDSGELTLYMKRYLRLCLVWMSRNLRWMFRSFFARFPRTGTNAGRLPLAEHHTRSFPLLCYDILTLLGAEELADKLLCHYL